MLIEVYKCLEHLKLHTKIITIIIPTEQKILKNYRPGLKQTWTFSDSSTVIVYMYMYQGSVDIHITMVNINTFAIKKRSFNFISEISKTYFT